MHHLPHALHPRGMHNMLFEHCLNGRTRRLYAKLVNAGIDIVDCEEALTGSRNYLRHFLSAGDVPGINDGDRQRQSGNLLGISYSSGALAVVYSPRQQDDVGRGVYNLPQILFGQFPTGH